MFVGPYAGCVARYLDVHPDNPQPRAISQVIDSLQADGVIAYPTDCAYALGCRIGNASGLERIRDLRQLDARHPFTLVCDDFSQMSQFVKLGNTAFRTIKACTPGPYTFILPATKEVPRRLLQPKKLTVGVRIPGTPLVRALLDELGEPLVSTTLLLPGDIEPITQGWEVKERLDHVVDVVIDAGECSTQVTTVVDLSGDEPVIVREGAGDASRFV
jgi:tRNA threonylcarbamoyl adenosine modification protein (Sua5/YciO/YrdC/YwlC family)